jgi:hypothetical protein
MDVKKVVFHVERLVLNGFQPQDRRLLAASLQTELNQRLSARDTVRQIAVHGDSARIDVAGLSIPRALKPEEVGAWVARAVVRGLDK